MTKDNFSGIRKYFSGHKKPSIQEIVREPTAGGVVFRRNKKGEAEFLLYQDARDRWTIPKGHIEPGETAQVTAKREIGEETGLDACRPLGTHIPQAQVKPMDEATPLGHTSEERNERLPYPREGTCGLG